MQQITFTKNEMAELVSKDFTSQQFGADDVEGDTLVTLISPGTELSWGYTATTDFPRYPGYAAVFKVSSVGSAVSDIVPGDIVFCMGNHASRQRHNKNMVVKLPPGLNPVYAVCARLMGVTMSTLVTTTARPPSLVGITGLGPVGNLAAQLFQNCGYEIFAVDPIQSRREIAQSVGITNTAEQLPFQDDNFRKKFSLIMECSGYEGAVIDACKIVKKRGEVVLVGVPWTQKSPNSAFDICHAVFHNYVILRSGWEWEVPMHPQDYREGSMMDNYRGALNWLAKGEIEIEKLYKTYSPADAQNCYQELLNRCAPKLLSIFDWTLLG